MVQEPSNYTSMDYVRIALPLTIVAELVALVLEPIVYGFQTRSAADSSISDLPSVSGAISEVCQRALNESLNQYLGWHSP